MREAHLRQAAFTEQNWKFFMAGAIGFFIVVLIAFMATQYVYQAQEYPVSQAEVPLVDENDLQPLQVPAGDADSADGGFFFSEPVSSEDYPVYYS